MPMPEAALRARPEVEPAYVAALEAGADDKAALFARWLRADLAGTIVDVGCGPGAVSSGLAARRPDCAVLGIDADPGMIETAWTRHGDSAHLAFRPGCADQPLGTHAIACVLSSVLHEVAAQGGLAAVEQALRHAAAALLRDGRLIVRDFVRPAGATRAVTLQHARADLQDGRSFSDFARTAGFVVRFDGDRSEPDTSCYDTDLEGAYEFALRKDCGDAWMTELRQRYAFWTEADCRRLVQVSGLRIVHLAVADDPWTVEHRIHGRLGLRDRATAEPLPVPAAKLLLVAERP
jgi:SAM-dependent methyltransferase